jgi:hypothetical protein
MKSNFLTLSARDFFKGLIVALISAVITFLYEAILAGKPLDLELLKSVGMIAFSAGLAYLLKNLGTNSAGEILKTEKSEKVLEQRMKDPPRPDPSIPFNPNKQA